MGTLLLVRHIVLIVALSSIGIMLLLGFVAWFVGTRRKKYTGNIYVVLGRRKTLRLTLPLAVTFYIDNKESTLERARKEVPRGYEVTDVRLYQDLPRFYRIITIIWYYMDGGWRIPSYLWRQLSTSLHKVSR